MAKKASWGVRLPPGAYYALTILTALNVINVWHRYLIYNLAAVSVEDCDDECGDVSFEPLCYLDDETDPDELQCLVCREAYDTAFYNLKDGACIDTSQYGVLAGVGFTIMFGLATLVAGRLTDTLDRRFLHTGAILMWSLAASAQGTCESFSCLLVARIFVGIGEAFNAPACYALITLYFPDSHRATANGIYSTGTYLGSAMSSLSLTLAVIIGWRVTAFFSGACGVACAAILFFTVEHNPVHPSDSVHLPLEYDQVPSGDTCEMPLSGTTQKSLTVTQVIEEHHSRSSKKMTYSSLASAAAMLPRENDQFSIGLRAGGALGDSGGFGHDGNSTHGNGGLVSPMPRSDPAAGSGVGLLTGSEEGGRGHGNGDGAVTVPLLSKAKDFPRSASLVLSERSSVGGGYPFASGDVGTGISFDRNGRGGSSSGSGSGDGGGHRSGSAWGYRPAETAASGVRRGDRINRSKNANSGGRGNGAATRTTATITTTSAMVGVVDPTLLSLPPSPSPSSLSSSSSSSSSSSPAAAAAAAAASPAVIHYYQQGYSSAGGFGEAVGFAPPYLSDEGDGDVMSTGSLPWCPAAEGGRHEGFGRRGARSLSDDSEGGFSYDRSHHHRRPTRAVGPRSKHDLGYTLRTISNSRIVLVLFAASSARMVATWSMAGYMATYYKRAFSAETSLYSVLNAIFVSTGGMASSYLGGALSDRLRVRNEGVLGYIPALGCLGAIIPMTIVLFAESFSVSVTALFFTYFIGECWLGPGMAVLQMELPIEMAGTSVAILLFLNSVVCNIGTWFIALHDSGTEDVRKPYYAMVFLSFASSAILFAIVGCMVSRKHKCRRGVVAALESAGIYEHHDDHHNSNNSAAKSTKNHYHQQQGKSNSVNYRSLAGSKGKRTGTPSPTGTNAHFAANGHNGFGAGYGGNERRDRASSVSVCEMVRRTFSGSGLRSCDGEYDSIYSDDAVGVVEGGGRLTRRATSGGQVRGERGDHDPAAAVARGEREALLMDDW